jgi:hypothetical protein
MISATSLFSKKCLKSKFGMTILFGVPSYAELSFLGPNKENKSPNRDHNFFLQIGRYEYEKIRNFTLFSNWGNIHV